MIFAPLGRPFRFFGRPRPRPADPVAPGPVADLTLLGVTLSPPPSPSEPSSPSSIPGVALLPRPRFFSRSLSLRSLAAAIALAPPPFSSTRTNAVSERPSSYRLGSFAALRRRRRRPPSPSSSELRTFSTWSWILTRLVFISFALRAPGSIASDASSRFRTSLGISWYSIRRDRPGWFTRFARSRSRSISSKSSTSSSLRAIIRLTSSSVGTSFPTLSSSRDRICFNTEFRSSAVDAWLNIPAWIALWSMARFSFAFRRMSSSIVPSHTNVKTLTRRVWPMRCARSSARASICGFQSESKIMTVSAVCKLRPIPPARVESMKRK